MDKPTETKQDEHNFFKMWDEQIGKTIEVVLLDEKTIKGVLKSVLTMHLNVILETKEGLICVRGQNIKLIKIK
jgi:small nuclear ribonucleoprotein (snRNP)-like protein